MFRRLRAWVEGERGEAPCALRVRAAAAAGDEAEAWRVARQADRFAVWRALRGALAVGALPATRIAELPAPRAREDRLFDAVARVRAGAAAGEVRAALHRADQRELRTAGGLRTPARALAVTPLVDRFDVLLAGGEPWAVRVAARRAEGGAAAALRRLATLRHPDDFATLVEARAAAGRRGDHTLLDALGLHGDPRALPVLREALHARDVDPGRGFVQRRLAADGLGRLGLAEGVALVRRALRDERADFEGRPGAGLGIQYPVRANLLWALGELGSPEGVEPLVASLGDVSGSAFGGFYLPAMDALWRLGPIAVPALERAAAAGGVAGAHAEAVLAALAEPG